MNPRIDLSAVNPKFLQGMLGLEAEIDRSGLDHKLLNLLKVRASQINGCGYCIDMHTKEARAAGESEQRLYGLDAWHETPYYSDRERAALGYTESITRISDTHVPDEVFEIVKRQFSESEIVALTMAAAMINTWNRLVVSLRMVPGTYTVGMFKAPGAA